MNVTRFLALLAVLLALVTRIATAGNRSPATDWFRDARYGVFMHLLPGDAHQLTQLADFDADHLARQLEQAGAGYLMLTLGQNSGFFIAPNATYDQVTGYAAGERCAPRDLPAELARALSRRGIRLMLYLPCQAPNRDPRAQKAFGLVQGPADQPLDVLFARRWAGVIQEWSDRYGTNVAGWWFDGGYRHIHFNEEIASLYAAAARHGNPQSIVTFNPGVSLVRHTQAEDYTAGELNEPFKELPTARWVDGSQWQALTFLGSNWGQRDSRFPASAWAEWVKQATAREGVVTLDVGPNWNPAEGPLGAISAPHLETLKAVRLAVRGTAAAENPQRLKRAESYFGLHFDFHAGDDCTEIGKNTTRAMIDGILDAAHPDYVQVDTKGHRGLTSYPTKVGNPAPGFVGDQLRLWREVTRDRGVALYVHHSGVWDSEAIVKHPEWAVLRANGSRDKNATSPWSRYAEDLLIPQLRELAGDYGIDGAWVDGECWAAQPDFGAAALDDLAQSTGYYDAPRTSKDSLWFEFVEFQREAFRKYLRRYLAAVRSTHPDFQLCSNWAFSDHMPEPVSADVDWISGDFSPEDAVNSARFSARYLVHQGKPWDLMAWSFVTKGIRPNGDRQKSAPQLQREAALVLSQGGGFQVYHAQNRDASVPTNYLPVIRSLAEFCRARQPFCQGAKPVPQIAFLYSTASHYRETTSLFGRDLDSLQGSLQALLEGGQVVDVVSEHHLAGRMSEYPLIVLGEARYLEPAFRRELLAYIAGGGRVLLLGPDLAGLFAGDLHLGLGEVSKEPRQLAWGDQFLPTTGAARTANVPAGGRVVGLLHPSTETASSLGPAAIVMPYGQGQVAATFFSFSRGYLAGRSPVLRDYLNGIVRELFPNPRVKITRGTGVDLCVSRLGDRIAVHLVNTSGTHWDPQHPLFETIPPTGPIDLEIRRDTAPARVRREPAGKALDFEYRDGVVRVTLPRVDLHDIVVIE